MAIKNYSTGPWLEFALTVYPLCISDPLYVVRSPILYIIKISKPRRDAIFQYHYAYYTFAEPIQARGTGYPARLVSA